MYSEELTSLLSTCSLLVLLPHKQAYWQLLVYRILPEILLAFASICVSTSPLFKYINDGTLDAFVCLYFFCSLICHREHSILLCLFFFNSCTIFHCTAVLEFIYPVPNSWAAGYFQPLASTTYVQWISLYILIVHTSRCNCRTTSKVWAFLCLIQSARLPSWEDVQIYLVTHCNYLITYLSTSIGSMTLGW